MAWRGDQALGAFDLYQERRGLMPSTIYCRRLALRRAADWLEAVDMLDATDAQLEGWLDSLTLTSRSRYWKLSTLSCFYAFAMRDGYVDANPVARIDRPRLRRYLPRPMSSEEVTRAYLSTDSTRLRAWVSLAALAGLRCGEIAQLSGTDIGCGLDPPVLYIVGKGMRPRVVPVAAQLERDLLDCDLPESGPAFRRETGEPYSPCRVSQILNYYLHSLGIRSTAHALRHYFASEVYRRTSDLRLVQELLGHSDPSTTAAYVQWHPAKAHEVVRDLTCGA